MILSRSRIAEAVQDGSITIDPFDPRQLNPNSYNYRLGAEFAVVRPDVSLGNYYLEPYLEHIPDSGLVITPGRLYLSHTAEVLGSSVFVTSLIGRSSVGRLGLFVQLAADLGQLGQAHRWTLELKCVQPIRIYPNMLIGQVSFWRPVGCKSLYQGAYDRVSRPHGASGRFFGGGQG
jgi:dCTP deaminase